MLLLPIIMEYSSIEMQDKEENIRKLNFYDYIYLTNGNELLKFKVELDHMDVVNVLEKYIDNQKSFDNVILSEKAAKETKVPLNFLYYLGKYKLENNIIKTKNYLAPKQTEFLEIITKKYSDSIVDSTDLNNLNEIMFDAKYYEEVATIELVYQLFDHVNVELVESFQIDTKELVKTIDNIRSLLKNSRECQLVLSNLKFILENAKANKKYIAKLGLLDKFTSVIEEKKQKVK